MIWLKIVKYSILVCNSSRSKVRYHHVVINAGWFHRIVNKALWGELGSYSLVQTASSAAVFRPFQRSLLLNSYFAISSSACPNGKHQLWFQTDLNFIVGCNRVVSGVYSWRVQTSLSRWGAFTGLYTGNLSLCCTTDVWSQREWLRPCVRLFRVWTFPERSWAPF